MHKLLERQIREHLGEKALDNIGLQGLIKAIDEVYEQYSVAADEQDVQDRIAPVPVRVLMSLVGMSSNAASVLRRRPDGSYEREWVSDTFENLLGFTTDELQPLEGYTKVVLEEDRVAFRRIQMMLYNKQPSSATFRCYKKDGSIRWIHLVVAPDIDAAGEMERILISFYDVTEQRITALEKDTSYAVLRAILDSTIDGVTVTERGGNLITCNRTFTQLWHLPSTWEHEASFQKRLEPMARQTMDPEDFISRIHSIMSDPGNVQYDLIELKDGRVFERYATFYRVGTSTEGIVWSYRDITERRKTESSLSRRLRYEEALAECSNILFASADSETALDDVLQRILDASRVSRVYLFRNDNDSSFGLTTSQTNEVCAAHVSSEFTNPMLQHFPLKKGFQRWIDVFSNGGIIKGSVSKFPASERDLLQMQGIVSILIIPIFVHGVWQGMIGFDDVERDREWDDDDIRLLRTMADIVGVYIEGQGSTINRTEFEFASHPSSPSDMVRKELQNEFGLTLFRINSDGVVSFVEGEGRFEGEQIYGKHYTRAFGKYSPLVDLAWKNGYSIFATTESLPLREVVLKVNESVDGEMVLDGGMRMKFEGAGAERFQKEIIGIVSHELRTPLASILGALKLLNSGVAGELQDKADALVGIARSNGERLLRLLNDIIDVEKIEAGTLDFYIDLHDLAAVVREAVNLHVAYAQQFQVGIRAEVPDETVMVQMDKSRIIQVLTNLLSNAVKFSPENTDITVRLLRIEDRVRVEVVDAGPGIPEVFRPRIFQKFARAEPDRERIRAGAGLGLSICKAILERHGGRIGFETEEGVGTAFYFELQGEE